MQERKKSLAVSVACMAIYWPTLKGERLSSVFSPDGTLISASAAPHCRALDSRSLQHQQQPLFWERVNRVVAFAVPMTMERDHWSFTGHRTTHSSNDRSPRVLCCLRPCLYDSFVASYRVAAGIPSLSLTMMYWLANKLTRMRMGMVKGEGKGSRSRIITVLVDGRQYSIIILPSDRLHRPLWTHQRRQPRPCKPSDYLKELVFWIVRYLRYSAMSK